MVKMYLDAHLHTEMWRKKYLGVNITKETVNSELLVVASYLHVDFAMTM